MLLKNHLRSQIPALKVLCTKYEEYDKLWVSAVHDMPKPAKV